MFHICSNATITIAADGATNCHGGLFNPVKCLRKQSDKVQLRHYIEGFDAVYCRQTNLLQHDNMLDHGDYCIEENPSRRVHPNVYDNQLSVRAWTLQETLLSPRILHFTCGEMIWQCNTHYACECQASPCKIIKTAGNDKGFYIPLQDDVARKWRELVEQYTERALTVATDRLPAISGIASGMFSGNTIEYFCGLPLLNKVDFILQLLWSSKRLATLMPVHGRQAQQYGPTWSWASVTGAVKYENSFVDESTIRRDFSVNEMHVVPAGENRSGLAAEGAYLVTRTFTQVDAGKRLPQPVFLRPE
ncbi:hypothetical protein E8E11_003763 [Didymella keratinophila]|nr:hypothetical protein E8E11_003763 [Didymella keratinophila]